MNRFHKRNANNKHTGRGNGQYKEMPPKCPELKTHEPSDSKEVAQPWHAHKREPHFKKLLLA